MKARIYLLLLSCAMLLSLLGCGQKERPESDPATFEQQEESAAPDQPETIDVFLPDTEEDASQKNAGITDEAEVNYVPEKGEQAATVPDTAQTQTAAGDSQDTSESEAVQQDATQQEPEQTQIELPRIPG